MNHRGPLRWRAYGPSAALIELDTLEQVHQLHHAIRRSELIGRRIIEAVPGATTLLVTSFDDDPAAVVRLVEQLEIVPIPSTSIRTHTISVCYDGPDLPEVASTVGCSAGDVVRWHTEPLYTVAFLGFSRGFPYLAGLDERLHVARRSTPRTSVAKGSVGIGAAFTGIYPASSPGGWQLLGTTEVELFDPANEPPSVLAIGDRVRFAPTDRRRGDR